MLSRASAAVVLWVLPSCVVKQPPQRHQFQARCPSGMLLHRQLQVLQLVPDPRWERLIGVQKLKCHKWMQRLGESMLRFVVNDGWWDSKLRFPSSTLDLLYLWKHLQHQVRQWKSKGSSLYGLSRGEQYKNPLWKSQNHKINLVLSWDSGSFPKKSIPKTATRWSNSWWTIRWMTLLLPVCVLQRLKFRSQYYDVAISVSWIPKRWLFETFFGGHWWLYTLLPCEYILIYYTVSIKWKWSQRIHVWYIYVHLVNLYGKCRYIKDGSKGRQHKDYGSKLGTIFQTHWGRRGTVHLQWMSMSLLVLGEVWWCQCMSKSPQTGSLGLIPISEGDMDVNPCIMSWILILDRRFATSTATGFYSPTVFHYIIPLCIAFDKTIVTDPLMSVQSVVGKGIPSCQGLPDKISEYNFTFCQMNNLDLEFHCGYFWRKFHTLKTLDDKNGVGDTSWTPGRLKERIPRFQDFVLRELWFTLKWRKNTWVTLVN